MKKYDIVIRKQFGIIKGENKYLNTVLIERFWNLKVIEIGLRKISHICQRDTLTDNVRKLY